MRLKLFILLLFISGFGCLTLVSQSSPVSADDTKRKEAIPIFVDQRAGGRGLAFFDHRLHECRTNPDPSFKHKGQADAACITCHHRLNDGAVISDTKVEITDQNQYQKCTNCHHREADDLNPVDANNVDLNEREIYHRLCITCHRTEKELAISRGETVFEYKPCDSVGMRNQQQGTAACEDPKQPVKKERYLPVSCKECHCRETEIAMSKIERFKAAQVASDVYRGEKPPPFDPNERIYPPRNVAKLIPSPGEIEPVFEPPFGYRGKARGIDKPGTDGTPDFVTRPDRWAIGWEKDKPQNSLQDDPRFKKGAWYNPYRQNVLKGDYPIFKQHNFLVLNLESETLINGRRIPVPSGVSAERNNSEEFFGRGGQLFFRQNFSLSMELFNGDTSFKPVDWRIRFNPNININLLNTQERNIVNVNPLFGANRTDSYVGFQELFFEKRLGDTEKLIPFLRGEGSVKGESPRYDTTFVRVGIQQFNSDFRAFIFDDFNLGARIFGQAKNNRYNFNAAYFYLLEKDTNSELNTRINRGEWRDQVVMIANLYRQDTFKHGFQTEFSFHFNNDKSSRHFDENDFPVRPALIGDAKPHSIKSYYLGIAADGHLGLHNINAAFYQVFGKDTRNPIAGREVDINAQMAAFEYSRDRDWLRFKGSIFYASGDSKPFDGTARGFDTIIDKTEFAGGPFSFFQASGIPFTNTGVLLTTPESLLPNLRSSKFEGQSNFVNPGILIYNGNIEADITPKLKGIFNANYSHFNHTEPLAEMLFVPDVRKGIGFDYGFGVIFRPILNDNICIIGGYSSLVPGGGFRDIFSSNCTGQRCGADAKTLYNTFVKIKLVY